MLGTLTRVVFIATSAALVSVGGLGEIPPFLDSVRFTSTLIFAAGGDVVVFPAGGATRMACSSMSEFTPSGFGSVLQACISNKEAWGRVLEGHTGRHVQWLSARVHGGGALEGEGQSVSFEKKGPRYLGRPCVWSSGVDHRHVVGAKGKFQGEQVQVSEWTWKTLA